MNKKLEPMEKQLENYDITIELLQSLVTSSTKRNKKEV